MIYGKYKNIRNSVWQIFIDFNIVSLPVSISDITDKLDIKIVNNSDVNELKDNERGVTLNINGNWYIVVDDTEPIEAQRFTAAHELGHILLGHMLINKVKYRTFEKRDEEEQAADMFAARLLAPACVLHELQILTAPDIAALCNISLEAAQYRAERMKILEQRNMFYTSPLERQVYRQFEQFIKEYHHQSGNSDSGK